MIQKNKSSTYQCVQYYWNLTYLVEQHIQNLKSWLQNYNFIHREKLLQKKKTVCWTPAVCKFQRTDKWTRQLSFQSVFFSILYKKIKFHIFLIPSFFLKKWWTSGPNLFLLLITTVTMWAFHVFKIRKIILHTYIIFYANSRHFFHFSSEVTKPSWRLTTRQTNSMQVLKLSVVCMTQHSILTMKQSHT